MRIRAEQLGRAGGAAEADVLGDREVREERELLRDVPDRAPLRRPVHAAGGVEPDVVAERDPACGGPVQPGDGAQDGRLAGAGGADEGHGAGVDVER